jgi:signal transduction histidine kinase
VTLPFRRPSGPVFLLLAALVVLPIVAILQYRWIGQVSDAERDRGARVLQHATSALTQDVDLELVKALIGLSVDGTSLKTNDWSAYVEREAAWRKAATAPRMVRDVLLVDKGPDGLRLRRWSVDDRRFVPAEWTPDLETYRRTFSTELVAWQTTPPKEPLKPADLLSSDGSAIVAPVAPIPLVEAGRVTQYEVPFGYTVIRLNMQFIKEEFVPALVDRHFRLEAGDEYRIAVVSRTDPTQPIYQLNVEDFHTLVTNQDATADFFGIRPEQFALGRQAAESLGAGMPAQAELRRSLFLSMNRRPVLDANGKPKPFENVARWTLVARHRAGSLEAAVSAARFRNLALSFGVLLLMFAGVSVLAVTAERAERLARQQMEFVAAVSHELRTPVSVIGAAAENLADGFVTDPSRVKQYGSRIQTEARRLGDTVERVLLYAGIEGGRAVGHRTPMSVETLINEALAASAAAIDEASAVVETDIAPNLPPVLADRTALRSTIQNLIGNALKYGGAEKWLRIEARLEPSVGSDKLAITVTDRGLGIASKDLPHIFEPFYRGAEAETRQIRGNGLGLSIVKGIVEAHGGRVRVESTEGRGSTFVLILPVIDGAVPNEGALVTPAGAPVRGA